MPELPEVETVARGLQARLPGERITGVTVRWPRSVDRPAPARLAAELVGREIVSVARRGKFVVLRLAPSKWLLVHLRMTGRLQLVPPPAAGEPVPPADAHTHVLIRLASGATLRFWDLRKFGRLYLVDDPETVTGRLGPEPLAAEFDVDALARLLRNCSRAIKPRLLDQHVLAGLGNIYVDEALWLARIHPLRIARTLTPEELFALHGAIQQVLTLAIEHRGTTFRDYRDPADQPGENQFQLAVYGRAGEACPRCGAAIVRTVVAQRGTHYCPVCQVLPGA